MYHNYMSMTTLKRDFWTASLIWIGSIVMFFWSLSSMSPENNIALFGKSGQWVALVSFVVGVISFLYGVNKLVLMTGNISKLRLRSFVVWLVTIGVFILMVWDTSKLAEHQILPKDFLANWIIVDIILGIASFIVMLATLSSSSSKVKSIVDNGKDGRSYAKTSLSEKISDELDDIIFIPKKKQGLGVGILVVGAIVFGLLAINAIGGEETNNGSQAPAPSVVATLSQLTLVDPKITGNSSQSFTGTIKNSSKNIAVDVILRVDFSKDKDSKQQFDTRYFPIDYVAGNGAFTFNLPFDLNYRGQYWWNAKIETAEFK